MEPLHHISRPAWIVRVIGFAILLGAASFLWRYGIAPLPDLLEPGMLTVGNLLGTLIIFTLALGMAVLGWVMAFMRQDTLIDPGRGRVRKVRDFYVHRREQSWPVGEFDGVVVLWHANRGNEHTRYYWTVYLRHESQALLHVELFEREGHAEKFAAHVGGVLGVPVEAAGEMEWHERHGKPAMKRL